MQHQYTLEELREMERLTTTIAANIRSIDEYGMTDCDLDDMLQVASQIAANLKIIAEDDTDLEGLHEITNEITANLKRILKDETDLDGLLETTRKVSTRQT